MSDAVDRIDRALHGLDDVLPLEHVEGLVPAGEQLGGDPPVGGISLALEAVDLVDDRAGVLQLSRLLMQRTFAAVACTRRSTSSCRPASTELTWWR